MLTRSSQIGEFYVMAPPQVEPQDGKFTCDLLIYDEESDRHVRVTWRDALSATLVVSDAAKGTVGDVAGQGVVDDMTGGSSATWAAQAENWAAYSEGSGGSWNATMLDCRIVLARPFIEHLMVRRRPSRPLVPACASDRRCPCCAAQRDPHGRGPRHGRHAFRPG